MTASNPSAREINCTAVPANTADYRWLRSRIALLNSEIEELIRPIYWAPYLGDTCQYLASAMQLLKQARDASHTAEVRIAAAAEEPLDLGPQR